MKDLITIVINVHNGEKYIAKCLESAINQTYKNLEILIINDASTDNTVKICKSYNDPRVKIITLKKTKISLARNVGIDNAKGKYLYYIDSDDFIEPDTIEYLYKLLKKYKTKIALCESLDIYDYNYSKEELKEETCIKNGKDMITKILLTYGRHGSIWNKLMLKDIFNDNNRFQDRVITDIVVIYKLFMETDKIAYSNLKKYYYLRHENSIVSSKKIEYEMDMYKATFERYYHLKEVYPNYIENEIGMLLMILDLYLINNKEYMDFLKQEHAIKKYKEIFKLKYLKSNISFKNKIKILLFRISPRLYKFLVKIYLRIK